ncbi:MAG TPA: hypothetical protein VJ783_32110 [Pirellulales bacterium]|nr:hypothetical protein [Pirellulales bacterium]
MDHNPFATRFVRPGALAYRFGTGDSAERLVERLRASGWWGQIIGPHGSGKSTLLASLRPALAEAGRMTFAIALHQHERRLRPTDQLDGLGPDSQLIVDGYEQLRRWARWRLAHRCRRVGCGLLVTAHEDVGLPTVALVEPSLETLRHVVGQLTSEGDSTIGDDVVSAAWQRCRGNLREALFDLYDLYESRRRAVE